MTLSVCLPYLHEQGFDVVHPLSLHLTHLHASLLLTQHSKGHLLLLLLQKKQ